MTKPIATSTQYFGSALCARAAEHCLCSSVWRPILYRLSVEEGRLGLAVLVEEQGRRLQVHDTILLRLRDLLTSRHPSRTLETAELDDLIRFSLQDVTDDPDGLTQAFDIVVEGYPALSSTMLSPRDVREEVCNDVYHRLGIARTLLLTGLNAQTARIEPFGTVRITLGSVSKG